jgi:DNA-binding transcriptional LysR family regulator
MDRMTSMATFVKVVESGGFSAAARTLSMSPSMVTAHVQSLEERLGVRLLNRSTRRVSLTEVGHAYYERCLQILAEADDADQIAQALQSTLRGTLRLNTSIAIPPLLAPVIAEFVALYPEVSVSLTMTDRMIDLVEEGFDLAVRNMSVPDSSLVVRRVATYRFVVCGAPDYLAARGIPGQPADLSHHNCLVYSHSAWGNEWRFAGPDGEQSVTVEGNLQANSDNALRLAAVHGQGLALAPSFLLIDHQCDLPASPPSSGEGPQLHRPFGQALPCGPRLGRSVPVPPGRESCRERCCGCRCPARRCPRGRRR